MRNNSRREDYYRGMPPVLDQIMDIRVRTVQEEISPLAETYFETTILVHSGNEE